MNDYNSVNGNIKELGIVQDLSDPFEMYWEIQKYYDGVQYNRDK